MIYVIDTEFSERPDALELISIGIASDVGTYYAENSQFSGECSPWVQEHVICHLKGPQKPISEIASDILSFVGADPEPIFWGYFADYDWVIFCKIFGGMLSLPKHWPMDIQQLYDHLGSPFRKPKDPEQEHHALADAIWGLDFLKKLEDYQMDISWREKNR